MTNMERDEKGYVIAAYQSCDRNQYEGAIDVYCRHLEVIHGCPPDRLDPLRRGLGQSSWIAVDDLHWTYVDINHCDMEHESRVQRVVIARQIQAANLGQLEHDLAVWSDEISACPRCRATGNSPSRAR